MGKNKPHHELNEYQSGFVNPESEPDFFNETSDRFAVAPTDSNELPTNPDGVVDYATDYIGRGNLNETSSQRIKLIRESIARDVTVRAMTEQDGYDERQGAENREFILDVLNSLPVAEFFISVRRDPVRYVVDDLRDLKFTIHRDEDRMDSELDHSVPDLYGIRAATIWINTPLADLIGGASSDDFDFEVNDVELPIPYVVMGHHLVEEGELTDIFLVPLIEDEQSFYYEPIWHADDYQTDSDDYPIGNFRNRRPARLSRDDQKAVVTFTYNQNGMIARMTTEQYERLVAIQDALLNEPFTAEEVDGAEIESNDTFVINGKNLPVVRAEKCGRMTLKIRDYPKTTDEISKEEFDLMIVEQHGGVIKPRNFIDYAVVEDAGRVSDFLGRTTLFKEALAQLYADSTADPQTRLDKLIFKADEPTDS